MYMIATCYQLLVDYDHTVIHVTMTNDVLLESCTEHIE